MPELISGAPSCSGRQRLSAPQSPVTSGEPGSRPHHPSIPVGSGGTAVRIVIAACCARWNPSALQSSPAGSAAHPRTAPAGAQAPPARTSANCAFSTCSAWPVPRCSACSTNCTPVASTAVRTRSASWPTMQKISSAGTTVRAAAITCSRQRPPAHLVQHLRAAALQPRALPCRHNGDRESCPSMGLSLSRAARRCMPRSAAVLARGRPIQESYRCSTIWV